MNQNIDNGIVENIITDFSAWENFNPSDWDWII